MVLIKQINYNTMKHLLRSIVCDMKTKEILLKHLQIFVSFIWVKMARFPPINLVILSILTLILLPPILSILACFLLYRFAIQLYLRLKLGPQMEFLSPYDAIYALEFDFEIVPSLYFVLSGNIDLESIRKRYGEQIVNARNPDGTYKYPRYHQVLRERYGYYFWLPAPSVDITQHVVLHDGKTIENREQMLDTFETLREEPIARSRPLWVVTVAKLADNFDNTSGPHYVIFEKVHHTMMNGMKQVKMYAETLMDDPYEENFKVASVVKPPALSLGGHLRAWLVAPGFFVKSAIFDDENSLSTFERSGKSVLANISVPISLQRLTIIRKATNSTVNDIVLSCIAYAIRCHFLREGRPIPADIRQIIPFAIDFEHVTHALSLLPTCAKSPLERLAEVKKRMDFLKSISAGVFTFFFFHLFPNVLPAKLAFKILISSHHTVDISNMYGSQKQKTMFNSPFVRLGCFGLATPGVGLSITIVSWDGKMHVNAVADTAVVGNREKLKRMLDDITIGIDELLEELDV